MKLVFLSAATLPSRAANGIQIMRMCGAFAGQGAEVTLISIRSKDAGDPFAFYREPPNFEIKTLFRPDLRGGIYAYAAAAALNTRRLKPDIAFARCLPSCYFAARLGVPVALELHMDVADYGRKCSFLFSRLKDSRHLRRIVVISRALRDRLVENYGVERDRILVAPDGAAAVDVDVRKTHTDNDMIRVGYTGHLYSGRGLELILALAKRLKWAEFHLVGGEPEDVAFWRNQADGLSNVIFHGFVEPTKAVHMQTEFDILLAPYQEEVKTRGDKTDTTRWMSPLKIFEYMAAAKPIVCSRLPALEEVIQGDVNGLLCHPTDLDEWTGALERLRSDDELRFRLGLRAREDLLENYTWTRRARRIIDSTIGHA